MDSLRMEIISRHIEEMDSGLVDLLKRYIDFTERRKPRIAVLCSDNGIRMEMEQAFALRTDVDAAVYGTFSGEDHLFDMMLSDAVVAATGALQIAPKGMYDTLQKLSAVSKEIYVLLGGWASLPRTEKMRSSKTARVPGEFPFSRIVSVKSYFSEELEGFLLPEQAVEEYAKGITRSFERIHAQQEEELYSWLKKQVGEFYEKCAAEIRSELIAVKNNHRVINAKQGFFALKLTHSAVFMQSLTDLAGKRMSEITLYDMEDIAGDLTCTIIKDRHDAGRSMKKALAKLIEKALDSCLGDSDSPIRIKSQDTVTECIGVMEGIEAEISNAKYIPEKLKQAFAEAVEERSDLDKIVDKYDETAKLTLERARERISAAVKFYQYGKAPGLKDKITDMGKKILSSDDKAAGTDGSGQECSDELLLDSFYKNTEAMRREVLEENVRLIDECGQEVAAEINRYSESMIKGYFVRIGTVLEHIEQYLEKLPDSYALE